MINKRSLKVFYDRIGYKFLELPNFDKSQDELITNLDKWVYLLKNMHLLDKIPEFLNEGIFQKVFNITEMRKLTMDERMRYERDLKAKSDYEGGIAYSIEKAFAAGEIKGEYNNLIKVALKMKVTGFPLEQIHEITQLPIAEIEKL